MSDSDRTTAPSLTEDAQERVRTKKEARRTTMLTEFEKTLIGAAEAIIAARDCPHATEYPTATPCARCIDRQTAANKTLVELVNNEGDRRFLLALRQLGRYPRPKERT